METTITEIYKGNSNGITRTPYAIIRYACGHGREMTYRNERGDRHSPDNWTVSVGDAAACEKCDQNAEAIVRAIAFTRTPEFSHVTLRDLTANKTGKWMTYCFYQIDRSSPTGCNLAYSVEETPATTAALAEANIRYLPGPSRGQMARV